MIVVARHPNRSDLARHLGSWWAGCAWGASAVGDACVWLLLAQRGVFGMESPGTRYSGQWGMSPRRGGRRRLPPAPSLPGELREVHALEGPNDQSAVYAYALVDGRGYR